jgi:hypothetical protein
MVTDIPIVIDLAISFIVQFVIFYFIMTRLNDSLGMGRMKGALILSIIFTAFHAFYTRKTQKRIFY